MSFDEGFLSELDQRLYGRSRGDTIQAELSQRWNLQRESKASYIASREELSEMWPTRGATCRELLQLAQADQRFRVTLLRATSLVVLPSVLTLSQRLRRLREVFCGRRNLSTNLTVWRVLGAEETTPGPRLRGKPGPKPGGRRVHKPAATVEQIKAATEARKDLDDAKVRLLRAWPSDRKLNVAEVILWAAGDAQVGAWLALLLCGKPVTTSHVGRCLRGLNGLRFYDIVLHRAREGGWWVQRIAAQAQVAVAHVAVPVVVPVVVAETGGFEARRAERLRRMGVGE